MNKFQLNDSFLQKYVRDRIKPISTISHSGYQYYYEVTVTYNPQYWTKSYSLEAIPQIIADLLKPIVKWQWGTPGCIQIAYAVEYHENGYPHLHAQIITSGELNPELQRCIHQRLCRRYGRSQWYQTEQEDKIHVNDKFPNGIKWSEYIQKDKVLNSVNGQAHYYQYKLL